MIATDVSKLIDLARNRTPEGRNALVGAIGDLIDETDRQFSAQELALMNDILKKLINDVAKPIRKSLAEKLAYTKSAPVEVIELLANDEIDVAAAILQHSELLSDVALIEIIRKRTRSHRLAIAMRKHISNGVCDALVAPKEPDVIKRLLENHGAEISQATLGYLVEQSATVDEFQEPLLRRQDLSADLAKRMYVHVSAALRDFILAHYDVDRTELDASLAQATTEALEKATAENHVDAAQALADQLAQRQELTHDLVVQTLRRGEVPLFEAMMSQLTTLPQDLACRLMYEEEADGFVIAARVSGFDRSTFTTLFLLLQRIHPRGVADDPQQLRRGLELFDRLRPETARKVIARYMINPDFLRALRQRPRAVS
ncbi:DUF2336 domain-containing protein [Dongia deserti]|uniref:DUF2336 domain-containing protein n=1 Tax=Dongia deserti TaxID=2268030 RepID=UPI000E64D3BD|nr:DUF2336 domain-containing protein [Dongia deserti]